MTMVEDLTSQDSSWADSLGEAAPELPSDDKTEIINPPTNVCPTCGDEITREPGSRGRLPKYHPECRPTRKGSGGGTAQRTVRVGKAEQVAAEQTEMVLDQMRRGFKRAIVLTALVDPYDALVLQVNAPEIVENCRPFLLRYEKVRALALDTQTGVSFFGLAFAVCATVLPIMAHHNVIPKGKVSAFLTQAPLVMLRIQQQAAEADDGDLTQSLLQRVAEEGRRAREAQQRERTAEENPNARQQQQI